MNFSSLLDFRDFLDAHGSTVTILALIFFGSLILLSLAFREILSWLTRTTDVKKELKAVNARLDELFVMIEGQSEKTKTLRAVENEPTEKESAEGKWKFGKAEKQAQFPLQ